ncbi:MAG: tyrosine-type recombinase/integrase, partial [Ktedonobacteraceae bacterium]
LYHGRLPWEADKPLHSGSIYWILKKYVDLAGLQGLPDRQVCVHSFRHTRARVQYRREHDMMEIKRLLGHSNISSTQIYLVDAEDKPDTGAAMLASELGQL